MASYATKVIKRFVEGKRNMVKIKLNHILSAIAAILAALCFFSIYSPVRFGREKAEREAAVKARLMKIRRAEEAFRKANGVDVECIEESVIKLLREKGMTFSAAESCTGGDVARRFTDMPGASAFLKGGVVTYTNEAKAKLLGIDPALIEEKGAVSYEVAKAMAENVRALLGTDIGVGVTGLAGPDGDGVHEVGTVFVSLAVEGETFVKELHMGAMRTRSFIRRMAGNHIYDMMRRWLSGIDVM